MFENFLLFGLYLLGNWVDGTQVFESVFEENFGFRTINTFKLSSSFTSYLINSVYFNQSSGDRLRCLSHCSQLANCLTVEFTRDLVQTDQIKQCAFYSSIPNFNSTDVIASASSNVYVKKSSKIQFNQSCVYDNCQQDMGLACVNGSCLCRDNNRYKPLV